MKPASVLFVCLGNICRSPLAEAAFRQAANELHLDVEIDSAGTGDWHIGHAPDPRAQKVAADNGVDISGYKARQVTPTDFYRYDMIIALDTQNMADLLALRPADATAKLSLLLDHVAGQEGKAVADPYYGGPEDFSETWASVTTGARALAAALAARNAD